MESVANICTWSSVRPRHKQNLFSLRKNEFEASVSSCAGLPRIVPFAAGVVLILYANREQIIRGTGSALLFAILTSLPLALWIVVQNNLQDLLERFRGWPDDKPG